MLMDLYMKFRNYIVDFIRARNIPADKWKKTIIMRKIMRISLFVFPLAIYWLTFLILWNKFAMTKMFEIIFTAISIIMFGLLLYVLIRFRIIIKDYIIKEYKEHFKNIGLTNMQGNSPEFKKMKYDLSNTNHEIYYFYDADVDFGLFHTPIVIRGLRNIFRGFVRPSEGNQYGLIQFHVIPSCKSSCRILTINDTWLVQNIIHLGIFGSTGSR